MQFYQQIPIISISGSAKKKHFHLSILKFNGKELDKNEKLDQIEHVANNVYENLSDNDLDFNEVCNPNVREIRRDFCSADFIVLYNNEF